MELSEDEELWAEMRQFWSDDEEGGDLNRAHWKRLRRGQQRGSRGPGRAPRAAGAGRQRHTVITHYNAVTQVPFMLSRRTICGAQDTFNEIGQGRADPGHYRVQESPKDGPLMYKPGVHLLAQNWGSADQSPSGFPICHACL